MDTLVAVLNPVLNFWLLTILHRQAVRKQLPWFVYYIAWEVLSGCVYLVVLSISRHLYDAVYWWLEAVEITLIVAAMRESFLRIFMGFKRIRWFRWTVTGVILAVVAYAAYKAIYYPPVQGNRLTALVLGTEFLFRWGIAGIGILTIVLSWLVDEPTNTREDSVVTGFSLISSAFIGYVIIGSLFGTQYLFFAKYLPSVGYFIAVILWIRTFSRAEEKDIGFDDIGIGPEEMLKIVRGYHKAIDAIRGKK
ncbi:MAG TPA: hypothetical protein VG649_10370 [Candidatus Angelobacter sp.]|jgi:hypothetical protein|nr:hypothetical protein [Candidatus Angelobacter sp.]